MEFEDYIILPIRDENQNIVFHLCGMILFVKDWRLCSDFIEKKLKPRKFVYNYDFCDTYENGFFVKDGIHVDIFWSIYTGYDFKIDKYSTKEQIDKTWKWVEQIFEFLLSHEDKIEKDYLNIPKSLNYKEIVPIEKPVNNKLSIYSKIKNFLSFKKKSI